MSLDWISLEENTMQNSIESTFADKSVISPFSEIQYKMSYSLLFYTYMREHVHFPWRVKSKDVTLMQM